MKKAIIISKAKIERKASITVPKSFVVKMTIGNIIIMKGFMADISLNVKAFHFGRKVNITY